MPFSEELLTHRRFGTTGTGGRVQGYGLGDVSFTPSPGHNTTLQFYEARVRAQGSSTIVATKFLGKPQVHNGLIIINLRAVLDALTPGNYTVSVAATSPGGTDDSTETTAFIVPLELP